MRIKKERNTEAREQLRMWAVKYTEGCDIQDRWPCGTCFMDLLNRIGLDDTKPEYKERNKEHDCTRHNEVWRAILQIREAKL